MRLAQLIEEDFVNYKEPSMFLGCISCDWKCCNEQQLPISTCQNNPLQDAPIFKVSNRSLYERFIANPITKAIVIGGLEPILQFDEVLSLVTYFRMRYCYTTFVIYTGYTPDEIADEITTISKLGNIVMKFGRYMPGQQPHFDEVLGVALASDNQYGKRIG